MRTNCRYYESRTYAGGETVRKCDLDLAPEAPWRCPDDCPKFEHRTDIAWQVGTAVAPPTPDVPDDAQGIAELLDAAEDIVNAAGPDILRELREEEKTSRKGWRRFFRR